MLGSALIKRMLVREMSSWILDYAFEIVCKGSGGWRESGRVNVLDAAGKMHSLTMSD